MVLHQLYRIENKKFILNKQKNLQNTADYKYLDRSIKKAREHRLETSALYPKEEYVVNYSN